jgi:hypothetical protein
MYPAEVSRRRILAKAIGNCGSGPLGSLIMLLPPDAETFLALPELDSTSTL